MDTVFIIDVFHLTALAITISCFLFISGKRIIELCSQTHSNK
ncbi:MAG: hypothetical protein ACPGRG_01985 [Marinomonas sp.]|nr:hypothetical protein [Marinomonas pontica]MCW8357000.1 hypothetical protein [Marinomonas pontica]